LQTGEILKEGYLEPKELQIYTDRSKFAIEIHPVHLETEEIPF